MSLKNFRYLNMSHKDPMRYSVKGSDKPCELHNIFNAMVASTRKQQPKQPEKKKMAQYNGKTPEQHLADAKAMTLYGIKVLDETPKKVGTYWQVLVECERCGSKKWIAKNDLTRTKSCGCLKPSSAKPKAAPFDLADPVENEDKTVEKEVMTAEQKATLMDFLEKKQSRQCDENDDRVSVSRRLVMGLADETKKAWCDEDFWEMSPAVFNALIQDTKEIYEALRGR